MHITTIYGPKHALRSASRRTQLAGDVGEHAQQPNSAGERAEAPYSITCYMLQDMHETPVFIG